MPTPAAFYVRTTLKHTTPRCPVRQLACPAVVERKGRQVFLRRTCVEYEETPRFS